MRILMVCLGNICRSPLAEGIMRKLIDENGLDWEVDSAATSSWHIGENPDPRAIEVAQQYGLDISRQIARMVQDSDFENFDLILCMDSEVLRDVRMLARELGKENLVQLFNNTNIPDPYMDDDGFEAVYRMLENGCQALLKTAKA